jgi:hypothetical protein
MKLTRTEANKQAVIIMKDLAEQFRDYPEAQTLTIHRGALLPLELCDPEVDDDDPQNWIDEWMKAFLKAIND